MPSMKTKQTFELTDDDVKTAVSELIERRYGVEGELTVSVGTRTVTTGYGLHECDTQVVSVSASREPAPAGRRRALQLSADEARADELRLVMNYLHATGVPALRDAARELADLRHRSGPDPR